MDKEAKEEYIKLTKDFLEKTDDKFEQLAEKSLGTYTDVIIDTTIKTFDKKIRKEERKVEELSDALTEVMSHLMVQNELLAELLVRKGLMNESDIAFLQHETIKRLPDIEKHINKAVGRKKEKKKKRMISTIENRHPETIKLLNKIYKERKK